nr:hypothetical protein [Azoarcus sp. DD4]
MQPNDQIRWLINNRMPHKLGIDIEVTMDQAITHPYDSAPRYLRQCGPRGLRNLAGRFTDDFQCSHDSKKQLPVRGKVIGARPLANSTAVRAASSM